MSDILKHLYNACDPDEPAPAEFYVDCAAARGGGALTKEFQRRLELLDSGYLCFLFSGHIGCGKSSELAALKRTLLDPDSDAQERFFTVLLDVSDYLDDYDVALTDILLAMVTELAASLREQLGIELKDSFFSKLLRDIKEFGLMEMKPESGEFTLGIAKFKVQLSKQDPKLRQLTRDALQPHMSRLIQEINLIFDQARLKVKNIAVAEGERPFTDLVFVVDNLEKVRKFEGMQDELESQRELFLGRYTQLTGLNVHIIYTVPLRLARSPYSPQLVHHYSEPFVLPMVKIMERGTRESYMIGIEYLRKMLQRRIGELKLEEVFTPGALDFLITYSGGHVRYLMIFAQNTSVYASGIPISVDVAEQAIEQTYRNFSTSIPDEHWRKLAQLELSKNQKIPNGDKDCLMMLENLSILEYINGGDSKRKLRFATPWYAVNPIVRELEQFEDAKAELTRTDASDGSGDYE